MKRTTATVSCCECKDGTVDLGFRPVHDYTLTDDIEYIKPKKRVY